MAVVCLSSGRSDILSAKMVGVYQQENVEMKNEMTTERDTPVMGKYTLLVLQIMVGKCAKPFGTRS